MSEFLLRLWWGLFLSASLTCLKRLENPPLLIIYQTCKYLNYRMGWSVWKTSQTLRCCLFRRRSCVGYLFSGLLTRGMTLLFLRKGKTILRLFLCLMYFKHVFPVNSVSHREFFLQSVFPIGLLTSACCLLLTGATSQFLENQSIIKTAFHLPLKASTVIT